MTLLAQFERDRGRLRAIAFRITGSADDADDALQIAWEKAAAAVGGTNADPTDIREPSAWLTTVVSRTCLDLLRGHRRRGEVALDAIADRPGEDPTPEDAAIRLDEVGRALLVVQQQLSPAQRVAFVLHDMFALSFDEIGSITGRSPAAAKKLASRARGRIAPPAETDTADVDLVRAYLQASRDGNIERLLRILAPDVIRTADPAVLPSGMPTRTEGADEVAEQTRLFAARARLSAVVLVDDRPAVVVAPHGRPTIVMRFTVSGNMIAAIDVNDAAGIPATSFKLA
ncbi:sigma-70 family RNA polymerase sigma factor [Jongsikchunia kroppenstedtii]|uniref:sigma-70 family RNA polymerase sigma factor n=1 Tax=Jongsikchunia kroppenstedtii TaxID=1121721 RepID=UPI00036E10BC|nr:sigma-70 family RNA polymerase sigma factor [Jongsikchunia kroppenstedtii]